MILSILLAIVFFYTGIFVALGAFLFPYYMIKTTQDITKNKGIIFHIAVYFILILSSFAVGEQKILLMIFIGVYAIIELIYFLFKKYDILGTFDKMIITSILLTFFIILVYNMNVERFKEYFEVVNLFYRDQLKVSEELLSAYNSVFVEQIIYTVFAYFFIITITTYITIDRKNIVNWKMSYLYLVLYIVVVILTDIFKVENRYLQNIADSLRMIYIVYGIKVAFYYIKNKIKYGVISTFIVLIFTNVFPIGTFIIGALRSFDFKLSLEKPNKN